MKIYTLYTFDDPNTLYGFTSEKSIKDDFISQRCKDSFIIKKLSIKSKDYDMFLRDNRQFQIHELILHDGQNYIRLLGTDDEDDQLSYQVTLLENELDDLYRYFSKIPFQDKYRKAIMRLCKYYTIKPNGSEVLFDLLHLFFKLFKKTYIKPKGDMYNE